MKRRVRDAAKAAVNKTVATVMNAGTGMAAAFGLDEGRGLPFGPMISQWYTVFYNLRWYLVTQNRSVLNQAYAEIGLVANLVNIPVDDGFRGGVEVSTKQLSPEQLSLLSAKVEREGDLQHVAQAMKWQRLFGGAGVIAMTGQNPSSPLNLAAITKDSPLAFKAADQWELLGMGHEGESTSAISDITLAKRYQYYDMVLDQSRVMRLKGLEAPSLVRPRLRGWGLSVVENLVRSLNQFLKANDVLFEILDEAKIDVYRLKNLANTLLTGADGAEKVRQRIAIANRQKNYQNAIVLDSEDEYQQKQLTWTGIAEVFQQIRIGVSADMRMPMSKLWGISAAGFNSGEDDIEVYNGMVESEIREKAKPLVLWVIELRCQQMFGFIPDDLSIKFKPLRMLSSVEEETVKTSKHARALAALQAGGISPEEYRDIVNKGNLLDVQLEGDAPLSLDGDDESAGNQAKDDAEQGAD